MDFSSQLNSKSSFALAPVAVPIINASVVMPVIMPVLMAVMSRRDVDDSSRAVIVVAVGIVRGRASVVSESERKTKVDAH